MLQKTTAITLLIFYALTFSGCVQKEYITLPCSIQTPERFYSNAKCKGDDFTFAKCIISKTEALKADYERLLNAFNACK
ncbi:MAG: hypothetical protein LBP40_01990 [Campylobacteraceae bacterium]|jgi:hypothetical protein|nr:hypothetical protein [Campylobacteraceae bacterium]